MKQIVVLGAGLVGRTVAADLSSHFQVASVDVSEENLQALKLINPEIQTYCTDLSQPVNIRKLIQDAFIVVGCLPGHMGYKANLEIIKLGKDLVDISFFPEDMFGLDELAKNHQVRVITDCGVAPGMGNIILGYHNERMKIQYYKCVVGGLPLVREWPYEYRAVFSPIDVIEEYIRPARYIENSALVVREALSDPEHIFFEGLGTLEAWNSDGLRSLLKTMAHIPNMIEKTMRYPGTIEYLKVLRESGFFSYDPVDVNGFMVRPVDITARLLFPKWKLRPGEKDITVMKIIIEGIENGRQRRFTYELSDIMKDGVLSMARTTGYTCCAAVHLMADGTINSPGLYPPEFLGKNEENFRFIMNYLQERKVEYKMKEEFL